MKFTHRDIKPDKICAKSLSSKEENPLQYIIIDLDAAVAIKKPNVTGSDASDGSAGDSTSKLTDFTCQFTSMDG